LASFYQGSNFNFSTLVSASFPSNFQLPCLRSLAGGCELDLRYKSFIPTIESNCWIWIEGFFLWLPFSPSYRKTVFPGTCLFCLFFLALPLSSKKNMVYGDWINGKYSKRIQSSLGISTNTQRITMRSWWEWDQEMF